MAALVGPEVSIREGKDRIPLSLDANRYATKKTIAQGMLDIALLTANASQLKYILQVGHKHEFYTLMLTLIVTSIVFQILVGVLFLIIGILDINNKKQTTPANILNDIIVAMIFFISLINVIVSAFGINHSNIISATPTKNGS